MLFFSSKLKKIVKTLKTLSSEKRDFLLVPLLQGAIELFFKLEAKNSTGISKIKDLGKKKQIIQK
jgi:hypothetical protein